jgi:endo-1,4-beta-xylanase
VDIAIPTGLNAGSYKLHIFNEQVNGDKLSDYASSFETINLEVNAYPPGEPPTGSAAIPTGKTLTYNGKAQTGVAGGTGYTLSGTASAANAGSYEATATLKEGYIWSDGTSELKTISWKINKAANPLKISPKTATVKYSKLKKKTQTLAVTRVIKFTKKLNDKKTYTLVSAKKGSKSFKKYFKISKTTGKVTIKKNKRMKKGTYKVKVKIQALGNSNYKASAVKTVTFKVKVK